ncbi:MAG TPA: sterol carrier protein domain-containing protein [Acidimicrobiia bacterium]|nr:sterol carrier protein domain-containing protein [Acidimicrobiia bacterium]
MSGRGYEHDGVVVFTVYDATQHSAAGTYRLEVAEGVAHCERVDVTADLELDVSVLGRLYLGGSDLPSLAAAGMIMGGQETVTTLHRIMRTDQAPWCPEVF